MRSRYCSKEISFSSPSGVFSCPSKSTYISSSRRAMASFSPAGSPWRCSSRRALTKRSSRVSSTVIRARSGRQYIRNWVRWNRFLLSAAPGSIVHRLYMLLNYRSVMRRLRSSSNSHTMRSISCRDSREPRRRSVAATSTSVKCLPPCGAARAANTRCRYFSSVALMVNSSSFSSMVFSFSAWRIFSFCRSKSNRLRGPPSSFSNSTECLYFRCRWAGKSLSRKPFFTSSLLIIPIEHYSNRNRHSFSSRSDHPVCTEVTTPSVPK